MSGTPPLVGVVTPVYNGGRYLAECIESVQAQSYPHWRYTIVDNRSTDETNVIANRYAIADPRIRVVQNEEFLPMLANWNAAMREADPESAYIKVLHADDMLFPECLSQMVAVGEAHPSVGIIGAYRLCGNSVDLDGIAYPDTLVSGRSVAQSALRQEIHVFGSPSSTLVRSSLVREQSTFYNEDNLHADTEVCYSILQRHDWGFVHQVLTYTRQHADQNTTYAQRLNTYKASLLHNLVQYGPIFFDPAEYAEQLRRQLDDYYRFLAQALLARRNREFWNYHMHGLERAGQPFSSGTFAIALAILLFERIFDPRRLTRMIWRCRRSRRPEATPQMSVSQTSSLSQKKRGV